MPSRVNMIDATGARSAMWVALRHDDRLLGVIVIYRQQLRPFADAEIALVRSFADQAVIAMENARLLTETREALEAQQVTAEVLQVINSSPGDLTPVFEAIAAAAATLCDAANCAVFQFDGSLIHLAAQYGLTAAQLGALRDTFPLAPGRGSVTARAIMTRQVAHVPDLTADVEFAHASLVEAGLRGSVSVPMLREGVAVGAITVTRQESRAFSDKQIALLENFAAQAEIAIENARLITETREALEQQTATAEVLQVINASPGDLAPVFDAMLEKAMRICDAAFGALYTYDGETFTGMTYRGVSPELVKSLREPARPHPGGLLARLVEGNAFAQVEDLSKTEAYQAGNAVARQMVNTLGARTLLVVALRKHRTLLGYLGFHRQEVRPFTDKQVALLRSFAAQAVIAMENARLITETQEALEQQTATAEVLQVINSSPGDLAPVFDAMLGKAMRLCEASFGVMALYDGEHLRATAMCGVPPALVEFMSQPQQPTPSNAFYRLMEGEDVVQIDDVADGDAYRSGNPLRRALVNLGGARTALWVALRTDKKLLGDFVLYRQEIRPFSGRQIVLLQNFAAQAVIAIENTRLITETREALEQQTATAEVLQVINRSPGDLQPVFETILQKAHLLCGATLGALFLYDGEKNSAMATFGYPEEVAAVLRNGLLPPPPLLDGARLIHRHDIRERPDEGMREGVDEVARLISQRGGVRTNLIVPLRKDGVLLGMITCNRQEVRPYTEKQIALLENFAAQAVIAIDNARLLDEIRQRQAELRVTFDSMGDGVVMFDEELRLAAWNKNFQELIELPDELLGQRKTYAEYLHILAERGEFGPGDVEEELRRRLAHAEEELRFERIRPDGRVLEVRRNAVSGGGFVLIYSDITERKRSEEAIRAARDAAEEALRDLQTAQSRLIQAEKMASLGQLTAGIAHEIKNPLNFVNNFASLSNELLSELRELAGPALAALDDSKREEADETMEMLSGNLDKIVEHGQRADNIVKSMLEHSRGVSGQRREVDLNNLIGEALNLAYHGARAQDRNFNIGLEHDYAPMLRPIEVVPQEMTRVFLNLFSNGFYAARKRASENSGPSFQPLLSVATRDLGEAVEIRIRDNGIGIPAENRDQLFQPFFTTKPTGEGTGLGLSISYDIVTQQHRGTIEVNSREGQFTEFTIRLPRR
jgi:PAS domain S-box-containing protein